MIGEYLSRAPGTPVPDDRRAGYRPALPPADPNIIALCGEVGRPGFTAQALLDKLAAAGRRAVTLVIDSHGGDVDEALRIVAVIHNYQRDGRSRSRRWSTVRPARRRRSSCRRAHTGPSARRRG